MVRGPIGPPSSTIADIASRFGSFSPERRSSSFLENARSCLRLLFAASLGRLLAMGSTSFPPDHADRLDHTSGGGTTVGIMGPPSSDMASRFDSFSPRCRSRSFLEIRFFLDSVASRGRVAKGGHLPSDPGRLPAGRLRADVATTRCRLFAEVEVRPRRTFVAMTALRSAATCTPSSSSRTRVLITFLVIGRPLENLYRVPYVPIPGIGGGTNCETRSSFLSGPACLGRAVTPGSAERSQRPSRDPHARLRRNGLARDPRHDLRGVAI